MMEVVRRYSFSLRVLLGTGCSWVEKVVDALESSASLASYLLVLVLQVVVLNLHMMVIVYFLI